MCVQVDDVATREKYVTLLGRMFARYSPHHTRNESHHRGLMYACARVCGGSDPVMITSYPTIWREFRGRFVDQSPQVRLAMISWARDMLSHASEAVAEDLQGTRRWRRG